MTLETRLEIRGLDLDEVKEGRIRHHLTALERRLVHRSEPQAVLVLERHAERRQVEADLRVRLGRLGPHLVSHQVADTPDRATRLAVADVERQLERQIATQRGEPTFGTPSRRLPHQRRPHLPRGSAAEEEEGI